MTAKDCCVGEPAMGDPNGLHSLDCPAYRAFHERLDDVLGRATRAEIEAAGLLPAELSTSDELRQTKAAFAASQADLTAERSKVTELAALYESATAETARVERERDEAQHEMAHARFARDMATTRLAHSRMQTDLVRAELVSARQELARPRPSSWIVARDGGRDCSRCDQEIRRGEAYELLPGVDELQHIRCQYRTEGALMASDIPGGEGGNATGVRAGKFGGEVA